MPEVVKKKSFERREIRNIGLGGRRNKVPLTSFSQPLSPTETGESKWGSAIGDMNDNMKGKYGLLNLKEIGYETE